MTADAKHRPGLAEAMGRSRGSVARNVRSPQTLQAWAGSPAATATRRRRGKRPPAASPSRSRIPSATDRHLRRCDPRTHGGTKGNLPCPAPSCKQPGESSAALARHGIQGAGNTRTLCQQRAEQLAARARPLGSSQDRPGQSGLSPTGGDHQLGHRWQARCCRPVSRWPHPRHAYVNRVPACAARRRP